MSIVHDSDLNRFAICRKKLVKIAMRNIGIGFSDNEMNVMREIGALCDPNP